MNDSLTLNLYTYVANNPLLYVDPSGNTYGKPGVGGPGQPGMPPVMPPGGIPPTISGKPAQQKPAQAPAKPPKTQAQKQAEANAKAHNDGGALNQENLAVKQNNAKGTGNGVFNNGRATVDGIKSNPTAFNRKSADEIAQMLRNEGYDVTVQSSDKSRSGAMIIKINNTGGDRNITQVQVSPGGGRHGGSPYVKISTSDQGIIKVVNGTESSYKTDGNESASIIFTGGK
ncbi:hypothetical protein I6N90_10930 [Paenibacillus sp. GSMTC-2017]|uniref:hypothetical protein n=1 Tax=Paenibacillus sp. GSMTC-2017 TaxID=2794350 RepID=UPI0018D845BF|nr:hypothetical protein [Paenibacillus sp. GSMTC-2017]MBH5318322.1 hypothetical protein [Paenibacillus sp. GSMTC-2017]